MGIVGYMIFVIVYSKVHTLANFRQPKVEKGTRTLENTGNGCRSGSTLEASCAWKIRLIEVEIADKNSAPTILRPKSDGLITNFTAAFPLFPA